MHQKIDYAKRFKRTSTYSSSIQKIRTLFQLESNMASASASESLEVSCVGDKPTLNGSNVGGPVAKKTTKKSAVSFSDTMLFDGGDGVPGKPPAKSTKKKTRIADELLEPHPLEETLKQVARPKKKAAKKTSVHVSEDDLEVHPEEPVYDLPLESVHQTVEEIKQTIQKTIQDTIRAESLNVPAEGSQVLDHLGDYVEEPYTLIESYFQAQHLERLVRHQIESYNHFINYQIQRTIEMFNPVTIRSENDFVESEGKYMLEIMVHFENFKLYPPQIHENNGATKMMLPQEAKLRNFTYASGMTIDVHIQYIIRNQENMDTPRIIEKVLPKINIGKMPIMLKSSICVLTQNRHIHPVFTGECPLDCGGYFIIKGSEKTVLGQERAAENRIYCFDGKNTTKWNWFAEIKSVPDYKCISPKQVDMMIASKNNGFGHGIYVTIPRVKQPIELFVLFRALGVKSDREICEYILLNIDHPGNAELLECLQASVIDANKYTTYEDALHHIIVSVAYTPINMDRETGARKKREFAMEVLANDLFPHCKTTQQKLCLLGVMAKKLLQTSLGLIPTDDRDSYLNKRIELTGTLLNNLFRNYFNKLIKEMQKQVVREINTGSWRSMEDYENIINMTNIYKILKSTTIENGINRALATGDFSIKQSNSSKVGVAQVLNRLTYVASLSHLRRINTPLEKSGELIAPRKLHNTTWGFLCPVETPEGQSIGVVKNISYMAHITIPTNSSSIYDYVKEYIVAVDDVGSPRELFDKVKVFVNGTWVGVTERPMELYADMKDKKYRGIISVYASVVFDYKYMEIRICNDGGRLTRPVLRVRDNKALVTMDIIQQVANKELTWNDLLTSCRLDESVIEYIDPEEQNYSMIAMRSKNHYLLESKIKVNYTHSEIHPSTIFGVLASCTPYPEHNQAPRNTYQCLHPDTTVWMADLSQKPIKDVCIGESVFTFHPNTLDITVTKVTNQFVQESNRTIYKITTISGREIVATEDHRFMTSDGWKTVEDIISDMSIKIGVTTNRVGFTLTDENNCIFESVLSISQEPHGLVSCIETESDNHSFIAGDGFLSHNCAMAKQAIGVYTTNYDQRMDKTAYVLNYPSRPLVDTRLMNFIHLNKIPSGQQIHVAIMTHTGYNQEDSVLINKGSIDRGMFMATIYHTEKDEDKNIIRDEIIRCKPNKQKTKGIKFGNYDKLNAQGFIPENELVENRDVIIAKIVPIKENRNDPTKTIKYEDQSKTFRTTEETYIDKNYTNRNGDGYNFAKVRVRTTRKPVLGDKFASRSGQKGTCGNIIPECDMPFTKDGLRPDIILNPHAIPSRMTIAQLKETILGKVLIELGLFGDGTSFGNLDVKTIASELQRMGYESYGNEVMYDGLTGQQLETSIFIGPVFYQRLKHMVSDKQHSRAIGPMVNLTRQPAEGRSRDGGFRIGEMERDVMLAHGMSSFCKERLYDVSDKYSTYVCKKCGMIAPYNDGNPLSPYADFTIHKCNTCSNTTDFSKVNIPYSYKLLAQELQTINIVPRILTE
jgi:DNA-directed RNA polymerase II subunit RPB2